MTRQGCGLALIFLVVLGHAQEQKSKWDDVTVVKLLTSPDLLFSTFTNLTSMAVEHQNNKLKHKLDKELGIQTLLQDAKDTTTEQLSGKAFPVWAAMTLFAVLLMSVRSQFRSNTMEKLLKNLLGDSPLFKIAHLLMSFGTAVILFVLSLGSVFFAVMIKSNASVPPPLPSDAHLLSLSATEWLRVPNTLKSGCAALNREPALNHEVCGFCKSGFVDPDRTHGYGTIACVAEADPASGSCGKIGRVKHSSELCGACSPGKYGPPGPSLVPCQDCIKNCGSKPRYGCGETAGTCVDTCPEGYQVADNQCTKCDPYTVKDGKCGTAALTCLSKYYQSIANTACLDIPTDFPFGSRSVRQSATALYSDHFSIRTAVGVRGQAFQSTVFDYEWAIDSNHGTDGYKRLWFPWNMATPLHLEGKLRTLLFDSAHSPQVLIEIPYDDRVTYREEDTYLITTRNIYNKKNGALLSGVEDELDKVPLGWTKGIAVSKYPDFFVQEGVVSPIRPDGTWKLTAMYTLPSDPALSSCTVLPLKITVRASDGKTTRTYRIHNIGSDRTQCATSIQYKQFQLMQSRFDE